MKHYIVARNADSLFPYQGWPTVARDAKGVLYVAVSGHRLGHVCPFGKNYLYISKDEGETWSVPLVVNDTAHDDRDGGLCAWGDGQLLMTWFHNTKQLYRDRAVLAEDQPINNGAAAAPVSQAVYDMWDQLPAERMQEASAFIRRSHDGGFTWDTPTPVNFSAPHGPIRTADGRLLYAGSYWEEEHRSICLMESTDDGISWRKLAEVPPLPHEDASDPCEPHCLLLPNGTILLIIRSWRTESKKLNLYLTRSYDGGKTFAVPQPIEGLYGAPGHLLLHSSGAVIISYGVRFSDEKPIGSYARVSYDNGETWGEEFMIGLPSPVWDHGYPSTVELSDGSLYTVYYQRANQTDTFNSLLGCRWELPER